MSEVTAPERIPELLNASVTQPVEVHLRSVLDVSIRTVTDEDEPSILRFLAGLCEDSRRLRFFSAGVDLRAEAHRGATGDDVDHHGVLAIAPERGVENRDMLTHFGDGFGARTVGRCGEVGVLSATSSWRRAAKQGLQR